MSQYPEVFNHYIISNSQDETNIIELLVLLKIFNCKCNIIPLFESLETLKNGYNSLNNLLTLDIYKNYIKSLPAKHQITMVGFSDSQRESGIAALGVINKFQLSLKTLEKLHNINIKSFFGNGLDLGRGGPAIIHSMQTIQGNHQRFVFSSINNVVDYFTKSLIHQLLPCKKNITGSHIDNTENFTNLLNNICLKAGLKYQEFLHNNKYINSFLYYNSLYKLFVQPHNFSSRATKRGAQEGSYIENITNNKLCYEEGITQNLRAIPQVNILESTATFFNLWLGSSDILTNIQSILQNNDEEVMLTLSENSPLIYEILYKTFIGLELIDINIINFFSPQPDEPVFLHLNKELYKLKQQMLHYPKLKKKFCLDSLKKKKHTSCYSIYYMAYITNKLLSNKENVKDIYNTNDHNKFIYDLFGYLYCIFTDYRMPSYEYYHSSFYDRVAQQIEL